MTRSRHRVVIVGAGFGGLFAAKALRRADVEVTVIDRSNHHLFQPLLYQMATGILAEGDIAPPIRDILRRQHNASVVLGEVEAVDLGARRLTVDTVGLRSEVPYDSLILATGADQSYFGRPEFARQAPGMKTVDHALELRGRIFGAFEPAEREPDVALRRVWMTFVVVGAGSTGVELAGQIAELARGALHRNFRHIDPAQATLPGYPEVFVVGDLMSLEGLPGVAQVAIQSGRHAARTIVHRLRGDTTTRPFQYRDKGTMATISRFEAIARIGRLQVSGFAGWVMWLAVHLLALTGFKNRIAVLFGWTLAFLGNGRPQRVITAQQVFARQVSEAQAAAVAKGAAAFGRASADHRR